MTDVICSACGKGDGHDGEPCWTGTFICSFCLKPEPECACGREVVRG